MSNFEKASKYSPIPKDKYGLQELTQMQRAFCEYLVMNEGNKAYVVNRQNFVKRQINLSQKLEKEGKTEKTAAFEAMIGKAMGIFIDRKEIITRNLTAEDKLNRKEELRKQAEKMRQVNDLIKE
jgi:hypothetical protein